MSPQSTSRTSNGGAISYFRKSSDNTMQSHAPHPPPVRNLSVPNDAMLQQMNKVGLFDRSPDRASSSPKSSPNIDEAKSKPAATASSTLKKKKNIIIDGMKSLRKSKIKQKPPPEDNQLNRDSLIAQVSSSKLLQQLSFSSDFSLSPVDPSAGELYNIPTNNCAIVDIDIGEPPAPPSTRPFADNNGNTTLASRWSPEGAAAAAPEEQPAQQDYFTESDKQIYADSPLDNSNEEIYFIDAPPTVQAPSPPKAAAAPPPENNNPPASSSSSTGSYIATRTVPVISSISVEECASPLSPLMHAFRQGGPFERLDSTMSTVSRDSVQSGDSEFLSIIQQQQDEDARRLSRSVSSSRPNYFIPKECIMTQKVLGRGEFGFVQHHFVHRDLAARNILLASRYQAKISDFGLSRAIGAGDDYYRASQGGKWPIKWYAPESFNYGTFSHASDVWSFGVTMWEMFSLGAPPYHDMKGVDVIKLIEANQRLAQPDLCPDRVFAIMKDCWEYNPKKRPSFKFLTRFFADDIDYQNLQEMVQSGREINANV